MSEPIEGEYQESTNVVDDDDLSADALLRYTQQVRKNLIVDLIQDGMPIDRGDRNVLLQALHDMDQTSVNRLKLDVDKEANSNNRQAQEIVRRMLELNPRGLEVEPGREMLSHQPTPNHNELPEIDLDEGEMEIGIVRETSQEFLERMEKE